MSLGFCLALAIYWEARSESLDGQFAVAQVIENRVSNKRYPDDYCGVVTQRHQFSFYWDGKSDEPKEMAAWEQAQQVARFFLLEKPNYIDESTHYHADYVNPTWASRLCRKTKIGRHIFYEECSGTGREKGRHLRSQGEEDLTSPQFATANLMSAY